MKVAVLATGLLVMAGCAGSDQAVVAPQRRLITAQTPPATGLWLTLRAGTEHLAPVGHGAPMAWVPAAWVIDEGATVRPGDDLIRYDAQALRDSDANDSFSIERDAKRREIELLRGEAEIETLQSRIRQLRARRAVVAAELAAASLIDPDEVRIAELQLADAITAHAAAERRSLALTALATAGAPVSGADLAKAHEEEVRSRSALAAPQVALELARLPAARSTVRRLQLTLADIDAQLGSGPTEGLAADLRTALERRERRELDRLRGHGERRVRRHEETLEVLKDPVLHSRAAGVVQLRDASIRPGAKLWKNVPCVFVLGRDGLAARVPVPEQLRPLVAEGARIALRSPAFGGVVIRGSITTLAPTPETGADGLRSFPATAAITDPPPALRPGMSVACSIAVDVAPGAAVIPGFCVADRNDPHIVLDDGTARRLVGWPVGSWFVAVAGLAPGERVEVPQTTTQAGRVRLTALVEPDHFEPVRLKSWNWEVLEVLPDGSEVHAGDRIARLVKVEWWRDADQVRSDAELTLAQARLDLSVAQLSATDDRAGARTEWVRAQIARERAALEAWVGRNAYDAVALARSEADVAGATVGKERAERELAAAVEEHAAGGISDNRLRQAGRAVEQAGATLDRARLNAAERELETDWIAQQTLDAAVLTASGNETAQRELAIIAGEAFLARIAAAAAQFDGRLRWVDGQMRNIVDEELLSPADGRLVYASSWTSPPRAGSKVQSWEPFLIAGDGGCRATFEVPARLFGSFAPGAKLRVYGAGAPDGLEAVVVTVANAFMPPGSFAEEIALGRTIGVEERIFHVTVAFTPEHPGQLPPGSSIHVDL